MNTNYFDVGLIGFIVGYFSISLIEKIRKKRFLNNQSNDDYINGKNRFYININIITGVILSCVSLIIHHILIMLRN